MESRILILNTALDLFMRFGVKSVSMDDISKSLGMSKKTLYQHFDDKRDLVYKSVEHYFTNDRAACDLLIAENSNAIVQLLEIARHVSISMGDMNPSTLFDLRKYYPQAWKLTEQYREEYIINCMKANIELGIKTSLYRNDLNVDLVSRLYISLIESLMQGERNFGKNMNFPQLLASVIEYHLHAIMSETGRQYLQNHYISLTK